ncbi:zinc-dependent alcohol dehydrogenase [Gemmobacter sp.]|uniref:zinc-dependent alcohol dehydrogenase n=1 Tax=Gemmobacter sp. TaxID=1898957 RepID=UPI002AFF3AD7|nr:alcohol dehydrogenase catalytic domain-containing protein [Gemmobacter sp.]
MLALQKRTPAPGLDLVEVPAPGPLAPTEVLIRVQAVGICGSDLHVEDFSAGYEFMVPLLPVTLGHEFAGVIAAVGADVRDLYPGQRVTVWPSSPCGVCAACAGGQEQNCTDKRTLGLMQNGAFAPLVVARAEGLFPLPDGVDFELGALTEPLCVAARAVATGGVGFGDRVVVLGPGTIGQGIAAMARLAGAAEVVIVGHDDAARLTLCRALGFDSVTDLVDPAGAAELHALAGSADVVFEATGRASSITDGLALLRPEGVLVATGIHHSDATFNPTTLVRRKLTIRGSHGSRRADWASVVDLLARHGEALRPMITHRLPLDRITEGFALARERSASKVMIFPPTQGSLS